MRALIDTQILVWELNGSAEISSQARQLIENDQHELFISIASLWEISIKSALGKLRIRGEYANLLAELAKYRLTILPISFAHTVIQYELPFHHRDPFDRIIAAQAISEGLDLVSSDSIFDAYFAGAGVRRIF